MSITEYAKQLINRVGRNGLAASLLAESFQITFALAWVYIRSVEL